MSDSISTTSKVSKTYEQLSEELEQLVTEEKWDFVRSWFSYWDTEEELVDKGILWGRFFLIDYFVNESPDFHRELIRENFSDKNEYTAAPRGFSKTTINQLCISFQAVNKMHSFIVIVEKTFDEASEVLSAIRSEFAENDMVIQVYGYLIGVNEKGTQSDKEKDSQGDVMINGVRLRAKGFEAPIRGLKHKSHRPDIIYVDDVEKDQHINSEDQRAKYRSNYVSGILPAVDVDGCVKVRGTILHQNSLLATLIKDHNGTIYRAYDMNDPENTLLWPDRWSFKKLEEKKKSMTLEGLGTSKFFQEYLNMPIDLDSRKFKWEWFDKEYTDEDVKFRKFNRYITIDVADTVSEKADWTATTIVDWDSENNWFIHRVQRDKFGITELVDHIFSMWEIYEPISIGVEKASFEDQIEPLLKIKREEIHVYPVVKQLKHGGRSKEARILGALVGRFQGGMVYFKKNANDDSAKLKNELYDFPKADHDDLADALAYQQQIGNRPFSTKKEVPNEDHTRMERLRNARNKGRSLASRL